MLVIGGLQKNSLIDYPGKVSSVVFFSGCNLRCPYCHNPELAKWSPSRPSLLHEDAVCGFLESRKGLLDVVVISGGEPTLQEGLFSFCERLKGMSYRVKLDTNGTHSEVVRRLVEEGLVDYFAMDIKTDPFHYSPLIAEEFEPRAIFSSIRILMESGLPYEFRTTCVKPLVDAHVIDHIAKTIKGAELFVLQRFRAGRVLCPEFFKDRGAGATEEELVRLQSIASPWVQKCAIR